MTLRTNIHRPLYESILAEYRNTRTIKVITGVRRCGKSTLLKLLAESILADEGEPNNIFFRKMDGFGVPLDPDAEWLENEILQALQASDRGKPFYVMLDEVQDVNGWEKVVRRLHTEPNIDAYITGSNAHILSSDLSTMLGGRYVEIPVHPLSFSEYTRFRSAAGESGEAQSLFADYLKFGGMPGQFDMASPSEVHMVRFLESLHDTIILNDVAMHASIGDMDLLSKLVRYIFSTSGNLFSIRKVTNALQSAGRKTSPETIENYLAALRSAFILGECEQTGLSGKQILRPLRKFYPVDTGLRNLATGFAPKDFGAQLECVVYNELIRRGFAVTVGALLKGEIDFVAEKNGEKTYIQVTESLVSPETYERELKPFDLIADSFPKIILTADPFRQGTTEKGIRIINIIDWLSRDQS